MAYKVTITISGSKGTGKTSFAFRSSGKKQCFSYDHKALRIKEYLFANTEDIQIVDGVELYERTPEKMVPTARLQYDHLENQIVENSGQFDWIIHDGIETLHEMCEMCMRHEFKLKPFQGFAEKSYWKYRRVLLSNIHRKSLEAANKGVIYVTYLGFEDMEVSGGEVMRRRVVPKWFDVVEQETDVLFLTSIRKVSDETRFFVDVVTSKVPRWLTGAEIDVTMKIPKYEEKGE